MVLVITIIIIIIKISSSKEEKRGSQSLQVNEKSKMRNEKRKKIRKNLTLKSKSMKIKKHEKQILQNLLKKKYFVQTLKLLPFEMKIKLDHKTINRTYTQQWNQSNIEIDHTKLFRGDETLEKSLYKLKWSTNLCVLVDFEGITTKI